MKKSPRLIEEQMKEIAMLKSEIIRLDFQMQKIKKTLGDDNFRNIMDLIR